MSKIKCITPDCPCWIRNSALKQTHCSKSGQIFWSDWPKLPAEKQTSINHVDSLIESELGFQDIQAQHQLFKNSGTASGVFHLLTLVCVLRHKNQYNLKC